MVLAKGGFNLQFFNSTLRDISLCDIVDGKVGISNILLSACIDYLVSEGNFLLSADYYLERLFKLFKTN